MKNPKRFRGIVEILPSGVAFGFLGVFGKWAYSLGVTPGELLSLRFLFAAGLIALGLALFRRGDLLIPPRRVLACAVLGILGYAAFASCYFYALKGMSASLTVLLLYTYPAMVTVGARVLFGESPSRTSWLALPVTIVGTALLVWGDVSVSNSWALLLGIGSAVIYSLYILASSRWLTGVSPYSGAMHIQLFAGWFLALVHFRSPLRAVEVIQVAWAPIIGVAVVSTVLAMTLFLSGLQKLKNAEVSILSTGEPVTAVIAASVILGERLSSVQVLGALLVLSALVIVALAPGVSKGTRSVST